MRHSIALAALFISVAIGGTHVARADVIATADLTIVTDVGHSTYTGTVTWDDLITHPFGGGPVDFGASVGTSTLSGGYGFTNPPQGSFTQSLTSGSGLLDGSATGAFLCADGPCQTGVSIVGQFLPLLGSALAGLPADVVYSFDGHLDGPPSINGNIWVSHGRLSVNGTRPAATPPSAPGCEQTASCAVPVTSGVGYVLPDGTATSTTVTITFPKVVTGGDTTITPLSDVSGTLPADVALSAGSYRPAFFELNTTAQIDTSGGGIEVCIGYDLTGTGLDPSQLRFLHRENGVFVDRTSRLDTNAQVLCGLLPSFSPVVLAVHLDCSTNADCNDGNPCTDDSCTALGVCLHQLPTGCVTPIKASLKIKNSADDTKDSLSWKFKGPGVNFGAPDVSSAYALCIINGASSVVLGSLAPAGGICNVTKPCWTVKNGNAKYKNKAGTPNGLTAIKLKGNAAGVASLSVKGKGLNLHAPGIPITTPVTAALRRLDSAACWSATFTTPSRNSNGAFVGKQ